MLVDSSVFMINVRWIANSRLRLRNIDSFAAVTIGVFVALALEVVLGRRHLNTPPADTVEPEVVVEVESLGVGLDPM